MPLIGRTREQPGRGQQQPNPGRSSTESSLVAGCFGPSRATSIGGVTERLDDLATIRAAGLRTGRYQTWKPEHGTPVRTTVGAPKFWRGALVAVPQLAPFGIFGQRMSEDDFRRRYLARLDRYGGEIMTALTAIARSRPGTQLVLLCFDDIEQAGVFCHRTWAAEWMQERHGIEVPELPGHLPGTDQLQLPF